MTTTSNLPSTSAISGAARFRLAAMFLLILAIGTVLLSALFTVSSSVSDIAISRSGSDLKPLPSGSKELQPLLARMAGAPLIKPAQAKAAVKDDGTAQKLLAKLKLQGVVQMGNEMVAYVLIDKQTITVRRGDPLLDFVVEEVASGRVKLSLQGVEAILGH